jgi:hypothetical protein
MFVFEVVVEFPTKLFAVSSITRTVRTMEDVVLLQDQSRQRTYGYRFVSYRQIRTTDTIGVLEDISTEKVEQAKIAVGGVNA